MKDILLPVLAGIVIGCGAAAIDLATVSVATPHPQTAQGR